MKKHWMTLTSIVLWLSLSLATAQNLFAWVDNLVNTEEHLLHKERIGDYVLSADGQRLLHDPYLRFDIRHEGKPIPADSNVVINSTLYGPFEPYEKTYTPVYEDGRFVVKPLDLEKAKSMSWDQGGWIRMEVLIDGVAGEASGVVGVGIYPPKPETGTLFRVVNIAIPLLVLAVFGLIYRLTRVRLRQFTPA